MLCSDESPQDSHHALQNTPRVRKHIRNLNLLVYFDLEQTGLVRFAEIWLMLILMLKCCERKTLLVP